MENTGYHFELLGKIFSHVTHLYILGYKLLSLIYNDGKSIFGLDFSLHGEPSKKGDYGMTKAQKKNQHSKKDRKNTERVAEYKKSKQDRAKYTQDLWHESEYFFIEPEKYDEVNVKKFWKADTPEILTKAAEVLKGINDFSSKNIETIVSEWIKANELSFGKVLNPMRLALCGECKGPHIFDILEQLGKEESLKRIEKAIKNLIV